MSTDTQREKDSLTPASVEPDKVAVPSTTSWGWRRITAWTTAALFVVLTAKIGYDYYFGPREGTSRTVESIKEESEPVIEFESLPDNALLLDMRNPDFRPFSIRARVTQTFDGRTESYFVTFMFTPGPEKKGPAVKVAGEVFTVSNVMLGNRASLHVHRIVKRGEGIALESDTPWLQGTTAELTLKDVTGIAMRLNTHADPGPIAVDCVVRSGEGEPTVARSELTFEREESGGGR